MGGRKKGIAFGYNAQAAVDSENQIIVAAEIHDSSDDCRALPLMMSKCEENTGSVPEAALADMGYLSGENLEDLNARKVNAYIAIGKGGKLNEADVNEQITATDIPHQYKCMAGKVLPRHSRWKSRTVLKVPVSFCGACSLHSSCSIYQKHGKRITLPPEVRRKLMAENAERLRSAEGKEIYKIRKIIVEPVFGNIKNKGIKILVRGRKKVSLWWKMACTAHNIEKIIGFQRWHTATC